MQNREAQTQPRRTRGHATSPGAAAKIEAPRPAWPPPTPGLRIACAAGGCSGIPISLEFLLTTDSPGDEVVASQGVTLYIDLRAGAARRHAHRLRRGSMGAGFKFENPNVGTGCACGDSFPFGARRADRPLRRGRRAAGARTAAARAAAWESDDDMSHTPEHAGRRPPRRGRGQEIPRESRSP